MKIIGLNHDMYISSAALLEDGRITAAVAEERLTRRKLTRAFPENAVRYCLDQAGGDLNGIDGFVSSWNPGVYLKNFNPLFSNNRRAKAEHLYSVPDHLMNLRPAGGRDVEHVQQTFRIDGADCKIYYVTHHRAHAANAFFASPFDRAAILTADAQGETESTVAAVGEGNRIRTIDSVHYPQSLGVYYATFTDFLGFRSNSDEWKVMALAAYADGNNRFYKLIRSEMVKLLPGGRYEFDLTFFKGFLPDLPNLYTPKFVEKFGAPRRPDEDIKPVHQEIAAAMQKAAEDVVFHVLRWLHGETRSKTLAVSGGFFMNSVLNGKIRRETPFEDVFISSCPDDSGNAIGAALYLYHQVLGHKRGYVMDHNFLGPQYGDPEIADALRKYHLTARVSDNVEKETAALLAEGKLVGWFQGRMEFGQRALGNRSILADPRQAATKDKVNAAVKYRESFRPFAPAILDAEVGAYFDIEPGVRVPFMETVYPIKADKRAQLGAVAHVDGSGRLQTVDPGTNPRFHRLISEFGKLTGVPILLNTSFNLNGEPIVCTPTDAIRTFFSCGLDALVMGSHVLAKP